MFKIKTLWCGRIYDIGIDSINLSIFSNKNYAPILFALLENIDLKSILKYSKFSFEKCIAVLAFVKMEHVKKIIQHRKVLFQSWISIKCPFYLIYSLEIMSSKSANVSNLVVFRDFSLNISNKNYPNSILTKFHHFIIHLNNLRFIYTKWPH